jgi:diguanylate cyclase (GGDEF)-like protein/PAS domain S-box-containing protein
MVSSFDWIAEECPDAMLIANAEGVIEYVNPAFVALTGYSRAEAVGRTPAMLKSGTHDAEFYRQMWHEILEGREFRGVFLNRRKNGELFHEEEIIRPVRGADGVVTHFICVGRDVTERTQQIEQLKHSATHDSLTDLPNRALFLDRIEQAARQAARRKEGFTVALLDLDQFRETNNRFGHLAGDAVLQAVASRTRNAIRAVDTVARVGGDEFGLILTGISNHAAAKAVLDKVLRANAAPVRFDDSLMPATVSIGAAMYPANGRTEEQLRKRADAAMYAAKKAGRNCCRFFGQAAGKARRARIAP